MNYRKMYTKAVAAQFTKLAEKETTMKTRKEHKHNYDPILKGCDTCESKPQHTSEAQAEPKVEHTPTPWSAEAKQARTLELKEICEREGTGYVLRAVNVHAELLSQLNLARDIMAGAGIKYPESIIEALAKAEGKGD